MSAYGFAPQIFLQGQKYAVTPHPISTLIAIPEIQRPFVWDATKVRNLLDSLFQGFPIGYLIPWKNPTVTGGWYEFNQ